MSSNYCTCWDNEGSCIDCAEAEIDRLKEENEKLSSRMVNWPNLFDENMRLATANDALREELARYAGAVEAEGHAVQMANIFPSKLISCDFPDELLGQRVRVLVMKEG